MICRIRPFVVFSVAIFLLPLRIPAQAPASAAKRGVVAKPKAWTVPRLPDGKPELAGFWTNSTQTPLQRPQAFAGREFLTDAEIKDLETPKRDTDAEWKNRKSDAVPAGERVVGTDPAAVARQVAEYNAGRQGADYNAVYLENGKKVLPNKRTSIITDPKNGMLPPLTPEAKQKFEAGQEYHKNHYHQGPEDLTSIERCITWITSGPPMLPSFYNNNYHILQTSDYVSIVTEMVHDVRIIPLDGRPHENIRQWMGDSRGHWEGDTLVVETTNFNGKRGWFGAPQFDGNDLKRPDEKMTVVERFTRTAPGILLYQFTVTDPGIYTQPWSGEIPMTAFEGPVYEYACHEGNYALPLILSGARTEEKEAESKRSR